MKRTLGIACILAAISLVGPAQSIAGPASAVKTYRLNAPMDTRQVVTSANKPWKAPAALTRAAGVLTGTLTASGKQWTLTWQITYDNSVRSGLNIADIHLGKPGKFGQILVRLCAPCKSGQKGSMRVTALAAQAISSGNAWATVITDRYPNGLIRGQIRAKSS